MISAEAFHADPEEAAEQYVLNRMPPEQRAVYEMHLADCVACTEAVSEAEVFIGAVREAARRKRVRAKAKIKSAC